MFFSLEKSFVLDGRFLISHTLLYTDHPPVCGISDSVSVGVKKTKNSNSFKVWVIDKEKESLILVAGGGSGGENGRAPITEKALQMIDINFGKNGVQTVYTDTPKNVYCAGAGVENTRKRGLRQGNRPPQDLLSFQNYQSFKKVIYHIS